MQFAISHYKMEEHYAMRIEKLIDDMKPEDAESLCHEMSFEGEGDDSDLFLDDLTDWLDQPFAQTYVFMIKMIRKIDKLKN